MGGIYILHRLKLQASGDEAFRPQTHSAGVLRKPGRQISWAHDHASRINAVLAHGSCQSSDLPRSIARTSSLLCHVKLMINGKEVYIQRRGGKSDDFGFFDFLNPLQLDL